MKRWPVMSAVIMLLGAWGLAWSMSYAELIPSKSPFALFPLAVNERWQGKELGLEQDIVKLLKVTDYMMRIYLPQPEPASSGPVNRVSAAGSKLQPLPVWLYVGYYGSQRTGSTYHSPKNCLPGAGWQIMDTSLLSIPVSGGPPVMVNRATVQKGLDRQIILYWYQDRGRVIANEYWAKAYLMWDALTRHRTDGALVRISVPVVTTVDDASRHGVAFLLDVWPLLETHLPGEEAV